MKKSYIIDSITRGLILRQSALFVPISNRVIKTYRMIKRQLFLIQNLRKKLILFRIENLPIMDFEVFIGDFYFKDDSESN